MVSRLVAKRIVNGAKYQLVPLHTRPNLIKSCIELLRQEWPKGKYQKGRHARCILINSAMDRHLFILSQYRQKFDIFFLPMLKMCWYLL